MNKHIPKNPNLEERRDYKKFFKYVTNIPKEVIENTANHKIKQEEHFKNGRIRTLNIFSSKNTKKTLAKSSFSRFWKLKANNNPRGILQEKQLNLSKNGIFLCFLALYFLLQSTSWKPMASQLQQSENQQPHIPWKASNSLQFSESPHSQRTVIIWSVWFIPKPPFIRFVFIWPNSEHAQCKTPYTEATIKKNLGQLSNVAAAWDGSNNWDKETDQKAYKENLESKMFTRTMKSSDISWETKRPPICARWCTYPGKTQEGTVLPLANFGALYKQAVKEKVEMHSQPARKRKACPNTHR